MIYKCAAINCRSGYRGEKQDQKVTFHSFPLKNKHLLQTWLKRLARKDYVPTKHSKLCSLHFKFEISSLTQLIKKDGEKEKEKRKFIRKRLRKDAFHQRFAILLYSQQSFSPLMTFNIFFPFSK